MSAATKLAASAGVRPPPAGAVVDWDWTSALPGALLDGNELAAGELELPERGIVMLVLRGADRDCGS